MSKQRIQVQKCNVLPGWEIVSVKEGSPTTEAHPETFINKEDAEQVAQQIRKELNQ